MIDDFERATITVVVYRSHGARVAQRSLFPTQAVWWWVQDRKLDKIRPPEIGFRIMVAGILLRGGLDLRSDALGRDTMEWFWQVVTGVLLKIRSN
jgi:hypothetical protein